MIRITASAIERARTRIRPEFLDSRLVETRIAGTRLLCKIESENSVGCFKGRGADSLVNSLPPDARQLVVASAGNFGLAMADAGRRRGIAVTVYAAETASPTKLDKIRAAGATVVLAGRDFDEAKTHARPHAQYVEDGREVEISTGAGTMAMEITASNDPIDTMLVPLGNGALLAGIGGWFRAHSPGTQIVGVCAAGAPSMAQSWLTGALQTTDRVDTIADGIAVRVPVPEALADLEDVVDDIVLVSEDAIKQALRLVHTHLNLIAEPSAVAGVAALLSHSELRRGLVCTPITGSNATLAQLRAWIHVG